MLIEKGRYNVLHFVTRKQYHISYILCWHIFYFNPTTSNCMSAYKTTKKIDSFEYNIFLPFRKL